jgi:hypothetical protein
MSRRIVEAFFSTLDEFMDQLITLFPDDPDFPTYKSGISFLKMGNPAIVFDQMARFVLPHAELIEKKNDDFFLKYEFAEILSDDMSMGTVIDSLKTKWISLAGPTRIILFDYLILLVKLAKTYTQK